MKNSDNNFIKELKIFFANVYAFFTQTQGFHWTVEGQNFFDLHAFFEDVYEKLFEDIDLIAERIRVLGDFPPSTVYAIAALSTLEKEAENINHSGKMVEVFLRNTHKVIDQAKKICELCEQSGDLVTQDILLDFIGTHEKNAWKAESYIK